MPSNLEAIALRRKARQFAHAILSAPDA